jgi:hypothetical protein
MNHDAYTRVRWNQAYVFAFCASRQWIQAARSWVEAIPGGNTVWANAINQGISGEDQAALNADTRSAYRISEYATGGHWKGPGSESTSEFALATAAFLGSPDSIFVQHFKVHQWHKKLTDGLELTTAPASPPPMPTVTHHFAAIEVRTLSVDELPVGFFETKIDPGGKPDFYEFIESMQLDDASVSPAWNSIAFVSANQADVAIRYELWDEDGGTGGDDDECDIFFKTDERAIAVKMDLGTENLTGDFTGVHNTLASAVESSGASPDKDRAKVRIIYSKSTLLP